MMRSEFRNQIRIGLLAAGVWAAAGCATAEGNADQVQADSASGQRASTRVINVEIDSIKPRDFTTFIRITGEAEALHDVVLSAEESGPIARFHVAKGQRVQRGQVIAELDGAVLKAQVEEARASASLAQETYERQRRLWEDERIGSEITFLRAKYEADMAAARLATLESRVAKLMIRTPIIGVFDQKYVDEGEMAMPGVQIARIVATHRIKVAGGVPERFATAVRTGNAARIEFEILPGRSFDGTINYVGSSVDAQSRTFPIEVVMDNPGGTVKPQMVANVRLVRDNLTDVIVIPQSVLHRDEGGYHVFIALEQDGRHVAALRAVRLGPSSGASVVVEEGLEPGDALITAGAQLVDANDRIRILANDRSAEMTND
jgi:RND family efflux transporter MFP subunit